MPIGLIRLISTQKVLKTCINKGVNQHFLGSNHPIGFEVTQEVAQIVLLVWMVGKHPMLHR